MRQPIFKLISCACLLFIATYANGRDLVVDLSEPVVQIRTDFAGADLLLFGAKLNQGDVIVVVRGPEENKVVRKKGRVFGIWVNQDEVTFAAVPSYYAVMSNRDVQEILDLETLNSEEIGLSALRTPTLAPGSQDDRINAFRSGLIRDKERQGLYREEATGLRFVDQTLFRSSLTFPANVPTGAYTVTTYLVSGGDIVDTHTTQLGVQKFGIEAEIYRLAYEQSFLYGLFAVFIACFAGWLANVAFRGK